MSATYKKGWWAPSQIKKEHGNELLADNKKLGGVGRLNDKWINKLQNYYGLAIRQNTDSLILMRKVVGAVLYHCSEAASSEARHMFCHKDSQWCKTRQAEKLNIPYVDKPGLPVAVRDAIMPIFKNFQNQSYWKDVFRAKPKIAMRH